GSASNRDRPVTHVSPMCCRIGHENITFGNRFVTNRPAACITLRSRPEWTGILGMQHTMLCIEDDVHIGTLVCDRLRDLGHSVDWRMDGAAGLRRYREAGCDLVILDLMLPSLDGLSICRSIRETDAHTPILMLTAKAALHDV